MMQPSKILIENLRSICTSIVRKKIKRTLDFSLNPQKNNSPNWSPIFPINLLTFSLHAPLNESMTTTTSAKGKENNFEIVSNTSSAGDASSSVSVFCNSFSGRPKEHTSPSHVRGQFGVSYPSLDSICQPDYALNITKQIIQ